MKRKRDIVMTEKRILQVCIKLFLEKGYKNASTMQIQNDAKVSCSSFQNIFKNKEGAGGPRLCGGPGGGAGGHHPGLYPGDPETDQSPACHLVL